MNILWIANDNCANNPYTIVSTINELYPDEHRAELVMSKPNYLKYPNGTLVSDLTASDLISMMSRADVIHLNEPVCSGMYPPEVGQNFKNTTHNIVLWDHINKKHIVFRHSNGTYGRNNYPQINARCVKHNIHQTVSTPDLLPLLTGSRWLPQPTDLNNEMHTFSPAPYVSGKIIISHSPTDRYFKTTDLFLYVCRELISEGYNIEVMLIEGVSHAKCMERRKNAHIHFDQCLLGAYGRGAVEGLAIGQIVVVGLQNVVKYLPNHPFIDTTQISLKTSLINAIEILQWGRDKHVNYGREWVEKHHDRRVVIRNLLLMYAQGGKYRA